MRFAFSAIIVAVAVGPDLVEQVSADREDRASLDASSWSALQHVRASEFCGGSSSFVSEDRT